MNEDQKTAHAGNQVEPIAIVGMSCRFPFASTLDEFWQLLSQGRDTITDMPSDRWDHSDYYDPDLEAGRKTNQRHASFLKNIHDFDPLFFNISPAEATEMNPSQKLMLELVWEAIESSSIHYNDIQGRKIGVYVGNIWNDFEHHRKHKNAAVTSHSAVGQSSNIIANRVSFTYGFTGPSLVVDTGCSSSLVALHLACQSLWDSSTEMSVVGGVNHILDPDQYVLLSKFGGLSSRGRCSTFDKDGDGFVRGEGAGILLLKKLSRAQADGDKIFAVIRGSAMNNNGYNVNLPATSVNGQKQVLHDAYSLSGIKPSEVHYVEAHGTGTKLGDPTETKALGEFFREGREGNLHIGSVKTNIGHLEAAAGIAGLIKVVLAMKNKSLPPSLHYKNPNPSIAFEELKLQVQAQSGPWPASDNETLKAGINSFGWGGTNAHTIIEEYKGSTQVNPDIRREGVLALPLSAKSNSALKEYAKLYRQRISEASDNEFLKICQASALIKPELDHRVLLTAIDKEQMLTVLDTFISEAEEIPFQKPLAAHEKVVMIFPGQGSQWLGMGRELFEREPAFRHAIEECDLAFQAFTDWSLKEQLFAEANESRLNEINVIQPALCAVQIALAKLWMSWGVTPDAVVGHSMGEVAAAFISGSITLNDAALIICTRSKLMKTVSGKGGAMAVTELSLSDAQLLLESYPDLSIAVNNSPKSTVLAGAQSAITQILAELEGKGLFGRQVKVDVASHSQQMDPLKALLRNELSRVSPGRSTVSLFSTVRAKKIEGTALTADYWVDNLRESVQFASVMETLLKDDHVIFIEVSPHPVLQNAVNECAEKLNKKVTCVASTYREKSEIESISKNFSDLFSRGYKVNWNHFYGATKACEIDLPGYPFQRERYEIQDRSNEEVAINSSSSFPLLGAAIPLAGEEGTYYWQTQIGLDSFPFMADHQVNDTPVLPGAVYAEIVFEAADELFGKNQVCISRLQFKKSVTLAKDDFAIIQLRITKQDKIHAFQFYTKVTQSSGKIAWEILAEGELTTLVRTDSELTPSQRDANGGNDSESGTEYYQALKSLGLYYGPYFQGVKSITKTSSGEIHFTISPDKRIVSVARKYKIHPAILDSCLQPLFHSILESEKKQSNRTTFLTEIGEIELLGDFTSCDTLYGIAQVAPLVREEKRGFINVEADITILNEQHAVVLKIRSVKGKVIDTAMIEQRKEKLKNWLYKVNWVELENTEIAIATGPRETWLVLGDPYGVSDILVNRLQQNNFDTIHVTPAQSFHKMDSDRYSINYGRENDYQELIASIFGTGQKIKGIIHIGSMCYTWQDPYLTADIVEEQQTYGSISFMYLHQQLAALKLQDTPRLVIVTNGIQYTSHDQDAVQPVHSPLWGMAKVMFNELTQYQCRYFDLSANPSMQELDQIICELRSSDRSEHEIAFRGTHRFVPRLGAHIDNEKPATESREFSSVGTYLVTGFRGLGFVFIEWMIRQGARNFALVSRTGQLPEELADRVTLLTGQGCQFRFFSADAGCYNELKAVVDEIDSSMPELKGVIHAAGVIEAKTLTELNQAEFLRILNPKVKGAWNLHLLTQNKALDCFILFSSASTLIGLSGQGSYVAANAFLDTLASSRKRMGLPGMSINWGVMKDVGMVANKAELEKYARAEGFEPVNMTDAMDVFHAIYDSEHTQIGIVKLHPETMASYYSTLSQTPYFKGLLVKQEGVQSTEMSYLDKLASFTEFKDRSSLLEELVTNLVAKIVKTAPSRIKASMTFKGLGIDSLMAIQLRNLLEKTVDLKLSVAMFWTHPTIREYAEFLTHSLAEQLLIKSLENQVAESEEESLQHWLVIPQPNENAIYRLFCFHDAGGNASLYHNWSTQLGGKFEVVAVELPGRGRRMHEQPYDDVMKLLADLKPVLLPLLDKPFMFFGHSMGGLIAFELTRELRRTNLPQPQKLFISSTPGLTTYTRREVDHSANDEMLAEMFPHLDKKNIADDELYQLLVGLMRSDLKMLGNYSYAKDQPLDIAMTVLYGDSDERVTREKAESWREETFGAFQVVKRPGGHRYIEHDGEFLTALIQHGTGVTVENRKSMEGAL